MIKIFFIRVFSGKTLPSKVQEGLSFPDKYLFVSTAQEVAFEGFMLVYDGEGERKSGYMPQFCVDEKLELVKLVPAQHFTEPPPRYTDASLVNALEEKGIGRPSTYAPIMYTITERRYVERRGGWLAPTELRTLITDLLVEHFSKIMDVKFTAQMEEELDGIEEGKISWQSVMKDFYGPFSESLSNAQEKMRDVNKTVIQTDEVCAKCGKPMVIKWGRFGKFMSCSAFPKCKNAKSISLGVNCPEPGCGGELVERRTKGGSARGGPARPKSGWAGRRFYGCSNYPKCRHISNKLSASDPSGTAAPSEKE